MIEETSIIRTNHVHIFQSKKMKKANLKLVKFFKVKGLHEDGNFKQTKQK